MKPISEFISVGSELNVSVESTELKLFLYVAKGKRFILTKYHYASFLSKKVNTRGSRGSGDAIGSSSR